MNDFAARLPSERAATRSTLRVLGLLADEHDLEAVQPLRSATNTMVRATVRGETFAVRLRGASRGGIDREAERVNGALAHAAGVAPEIVAADPASGALATRFVEGDPFPEPPRRDVPRGELAALAASLARVRRCAGFRGTLDPVEVIDSYSRALARVPDPPRGIPLDALEHRRVEILRALPPRSTLVPSHGDLTPANVLFAQEGRGTRALLLDWEFSGLADPHWDIAYFIRQAELSGSEESAFLGDLASVAAFSTDERTLSWWKTTMDLVVDLWLALVRTTGPGAGQNRPVS